MNYWYIARPNELFIDTDNFTASIAHTRARLQGAIEIGKLDVLCVVSRQSRRANHIHTIITLNHDLLPIQRYVWEIILHGDLYRGCCNIMRDFYQIPSADVLISPFPDFHQSNEDECNFKTEPHLRNCDGICKCETKHNAETMKTCHAAKMFRGDYRAIGFFGKPSKNPCTVWPEKL